MAFGNSGFQARLSPTSTNRSFGVTPSEQARVDSINRGRNIAGELTQFSGGTKNATQALTLLLNSTALGGTGGVTGRPGTGQTVSNIPGAGSGISGIEGSNRINSPSLLSQRGTISRRFDTSGVDSRGISTVGSGGGGGGGGGGNGSDFASVSQSSSDIQSQLDPLLSQIVAQGGTDQARAASAARSSATDSLLQTLGQLTPQAAEARAQGAIDAVVRRSLESALPNIQGAAEAAGTSQDALQALQINDLAARTGEAAASVLLSAITDFAQTQAAVGGTVEDLTARDPVSDELITLLTGTPSETQTRNFQGSLGLFDEGSETAALLASLGITPESINGLTTGAAAPGAGAVQGGGGPQRLGAG